MSEGIGIATEILNITETVVSGTPVYSTPFPFGESRGSVQFIAEGDGTLSYDASVEVTNDPDQLAWVVDPALNVTQSAAGPTISNGGVVDTVWAFMRIKVNSFSQSSGTNKRLRALLGR